MHKNNFGDLPLGRMARLRWRATVTYRTDSGPLDVVHDLAEIAELHALVEHGPHWYTIIEIRIVRVVGGDGPLTIEEAEQL